MIIEIPLKKLLSANNKFTYKYGNPPLYEECVFVYTKNSLLKLMICSSKSIIELEYNAPRENAESLFYFSRFDLEGAHKLEIDPDKQFVWINSEQIETFIGYPSSVILPYVSAEYEEIYKKNCFELSKWGGTVEKWSARFELNESSKEDLIKNFGKSRMLKVCVSNNETRYLKITFKNLSFYPSYQIYDS